MSFVLPNSGWMLQPADTVLAGYIALQALRGAARGAFAMLAAGLAFTLALAVALSAATLGLPLPIVEREAALGVGLVAFVVTHVLAERLIAVLFAPAALPLAIVPGGSLAERIAGAAVGVLYGVVTAALILALVAEHTAVLPFAQWLDGATYSSALIDAGNTGLAWLATASATVMARLQERWSF